MASMASILAARIRSLVSKAPYSNNVNTIHSAREASPTAHGIASARIIAKT